MDSSNNGSRPVSDSDGTDTHDLLNEATEWLQYARGLIELLAELVHESDSIDCRRMALGLEAIGSLTRLGLQRTAEAHARLVWERVGVTQHESDVCG